MQTTLTAAQQTAAQNLANANKNDISGILTYILNSGIMTDCFTNKDWELLSNYEFGDFMGYANIDLANDLMQEIEGVNLEGYTLLNKFCAINDDYDATAKYIASIS